MYTDKYGVQFSDDKKTLIVCPVEFEGEYVIPDSVTEIGDSAFDGCTGLTSVTIPNSVTRIGESAFYGCKGLTSVTLPDSVTEIGDFAFDECWGLNAPVYNAHVFARLPYCYYLNAYTVPKGIKSIAGGAFNGCKFLVYLILPNGVTTIGNYAFMGCKHVLSIYIPVSVTAMGTHLFDGCDELNVILIPKGNRAYIVQIDSSTGIEQSTIDRIREA